MNTGTYKSKATNILVKSKNAKIVSIKGPKLFDIVTISVSRYVCRLG